MSTRLKNRKSDTVNECKTRRCCHSVYRPISVAETGTSLLVNGRDACQDGDWNENITRYSTRVSSPFKSPALPTGICGSAGNSLGNSNAIEHTCEIEQRGEYSAITSR